MSVMNKKRGVTHPLLALTFGVLALPSAWAAEEVGTHADEENMTLVSSRAITLPDVMQAILARSPGRGIAAVREAESQALSARAHSFISQAPALVLRQQTDQLYRNRLLRESEVGVELPLWSWGERSALSQLALASEAQAQGEDAAHRWDVCGLTRELVWRVKITEAQLRLAQAGVISAETLQRDVEKRIKAGDIAPLERLSAKNLVLERETNAHLASVMFADAMFGYRIHSGLQVLPEYVEETLAAENDDDTPALLAARVNYQRLQADEAQLRAIGAGNPKLLLSTRSQTDAYGLSEESLGATLSLPFGGSVHRNARLAQAQVFSAQAERILQQAERSQALMRHEAEHELHSKETLVAQATARLVLVREEYRLAIRAFQLGEMNLAERVIIENRSRQAEFDAVIRELEHQLAIARFNQMYGVFL